MFWNWELSKSLKFYKELMKRVRSFKKPISVPVRRFSSVSADETVNRDLFGYFYYIGL